MINYYPSYPDIVMSYVQSYFPIRMDDLSCHIYVVHRNVICKRNENSWQICYIQIIEHNLFPAQFDQSISHFEKSLMVIVWLLYHHRHGPSFATFDTLPPILSTLFGYWITFLTCTVGSPLLCSCIYSAAIPYTSSLVSPPCLCDENYMKRDGQNAIGSLSDLLAKSAKLI
jgi:hypothetical protein